MVLSNEITFFKRNRECDAIQFLENRFIFTLVQISSIFREAKRINQCYKCKNLYLILVDKCKHPSTPQVK